jgi:hypothetical protein
MNLSRRMSEAHQVLLIGGAHTLQRIEASSALDSGVLHDSKVGCCVLWLPPFSLQLSRNHPRSGTPSSSRRSHWNLRCLPRLRQGISLRLAGYESYHLARAPSGAIGRTRSQARCLSDWFNNRSISSPSPKEPRVSRGSAFPNPLSRQSSAPPGRRPAFRWEQIPCSLLRGKPAAAGQFSVPDP